MRVSLSHICSISMYITFPYNLLFTIIDKLFSLVQQQQHRHWERHINTYSRRWRRHTTTVRFLLYMTRNWFTWSNSLFKTTIKTVHFAPIRTAYAFFKAFQIHPNHWNVNGVCCVNSTTVYRHFHSENAISWLCPPTPLSNTLWEVLFANVLCTVVLEFNP